MASAKIEQVEPGPEEMFRDYLYSGDSYTGLNYDQKNGKVIAFRNALKTIQAIGRNHGLCEGETLILINQLYRRGVLWETIKWREMESVKEFVANNADRINDAVLISRGIKTEPVMAGESRTEW